MDLGAPGALDERGLAAGEPVDARVRARKAGLVGHVDVEDGQGAAARGGEHVAQARNHPPALHGLGEHAAQPALAHVRLVHDVVLHLDDAQRRAIHVEDEVGHRIPPAACS